MNFGQAANIAHRSAVVMHLKDPSTGGVDIASGTLVSLAGVPFVLTAGHNLEGLRNQDVFLMFPMKQLVLPGLGGRSVVSLRATMDPDVGVIELDPSDAVFWRHMTALTEDSFIGMHDVTPEDTLLLLGFPAAKARVDTLSSVEDPAQSPLVTSAGLAIRATLNPEVRSPYEPRGGRGFQVMFHGDQFYDIDSNENVMLPQPNGMSGGPLVAVSHVRTGLLGLARSIHGKSAQYEWCEPAFEAIRLLLSHGSSEVVERVRLIISRLEHGG